MVEDPLSMQAFLCSFRCIQGVGFSSSAIHLQYLNNVFITLDNIGFEERGEDFRQQSDEEVHSMEMMKMKQRLKSQDHDVPSTDSPRG